MIHGCSVFLALQRSDEAETCLKDSLGAQPSRLQALTLRLLARLYHDSGRFDQASEHYRKALSLYRRLNDKDGEAETLQGLALLAEESGQLVASLRLSLDAAEVLRQNGRTYELAHQWASIGRRRSGLGQHQEGIVDLALAVTVFARIRLE